MFLFFIFISMFAAHMIIFLKVGLIHVHTEMNVFKAFLKLGITEYIGPFLLIIDLLSS